MSTIKFQDVLKKSRDIKKQLDELQSSVYVVLPHEDQDSGLSLYFISYFDHASETMKFNITDTRLGEIRLISDVPVKALSAYSKFVDSIVQWQEDGEFPYSAQTGNATAEQLHKVASYSVDSHLDGDEGRLE